jgi:hypothetical protein
LRRKVQNRTAPGNLIELQARTIMIAKELFKSFCNCNYKLEIFPYLSSVIVSTALYVCYNRTQSVNFLRTLSIHKL